MNKIAALDSGTSFHIVSLHKEPFKGYFERVIYILDLEKEDLNDVDILLVTCCSYTQKLIECKDIFYKFLKNGKTLVAMGRNSVQNWLEMVKPAKLPFNFWWWLDSNDSIDIEPTIKDYELFDFVKFEDMVWHYHDGFEHLDGAKSVIEHKTKRKSIFLDKKYYFGGRLILTSLDPFYHHGSFFMPNATKFAKGFLEYLKNVDLKK